MGRARDQRRCRVFASRYARCAASTPARSDTCGTATSHHAPPSSVVRRCVVSITSTCSFRRAGAFHLAAQLADVAHVHGFGAHRARMHREIDRRALAALRHAVVEHVVEARAAAFQLQPLDAAVAAVVEDHDDELAAEHHRRREFRVEHHVRAVADDHDHFAFGPREFRAEAARDLVAHARVRVVHVVVARRAAAPQLVQFGRQRAGRAHDEIIARAVAARVDRGVAHRADHFRVVRGVSFGMRVVAGHARVPCGGGAVAGGPCRIGLPAGQRADSWPRPVRASATSCRPRFCPRRTAARSGLNSVALP